jgi:hypothetical protein
MAQQDHPQGVVLLVDGGKFLDSLERKRAGLFQDASVSPIQQARIKTNCDLLNEHNPQRERKRAQTNLRKIFQHSQALFLLCGLTTGYTAIAGIKANDGLMRLLAWWDKADRPPALDKTDQFPDLAKIQPETWSTSAGRKQKLGSGPPSKRRLRTNTGLADLDPLDSELRFLQGCRMVLQRLYPRQDAKSLLSLSREELISLLDPTFQNLSEGSQTSASTPEEADLSWMGWSKSFLTREPC